MPVTKCLYTRLAVLSRIDTRLAVAKVSRVRVTVRVRVS